ncbi:MAG: GNAT family N-acetyltransferase, partial [Clostridia bacterium]|nr:GNAT family N-acetyltransferase [Clostridia bacterium]
MYNELYELFRRNFPDTIRAESTARRLLSAPENKIFTETRDGRIVGAAVLHKSNLLMLAVDAAYRRQGIGARLLASAEDAARAAGYAAMTCGAGEDYLTPGVPTDAPVLDGRLSEAAAFFAKRGYAHSWGCECFDMAMALSDFAAKPETQGITYRFAAEEDLAGIHACTDD